MVSRATELRLVSLAGALLAIAFIGWPRLDLLVSDFFRQADWQFLVDVDGPLREFLYRITPPASRLLLLSLAGLFVLSFSQRPSWLHARRASVAFLLGAALLGPVLVIDVGLKGYGGRARPQKVEELGGKQIFTPAFIPANECKWNCSFVSGHVATASFFMAFGWLGTLRTRRRWMLGATVFAAYMAWTRVSLGGHFLSDTVFAWFFTYYSLWLTEFIFRRFGWLPQGPPPSDKPQP